MAQRFGAHACRPLPGIAPNAPPDGTEVISGLQTLSRAYVNAAGQVVAADSYFNLSGLAYTTAVMGAVGVNFYQTQYAYDSRVQHLLRENGADAEANVFPFGQGDAPRQPGGTVQLIDEVLGNALHVGPHFFYLRSGFFGSCHP